MVVDDDVSDAHAATIFRSKYWPTATPSNRPRVELTHFLLFLNKVQSPPTLPSLHFFRRTRAVTRSPSPCCWGKATEYIKHFTPKLQAMCSSETSATTIRLDGAMNQKTTTCIMNTFGYNGVKLIVFDQPEYHYWLRKTYCICILKYYKNLTRLDAPLLVPQKYKFQDVFLTNHCN